MSQFSGYIGNSPAPKGTRIISQGNFPADQDYLRIPNGYTVGAIMVYIDGLRMNTTQYIADDGISVIFHQPFPVGTRYLVEEISQFELPNTSAIDSPVLTTVGRYPINYTTDLWNNAVVNPVHVSINDVFDSLFYDSTKTIGSGNSWQVISLVGSPPQGTEGLNSNGRIYVENSGNYIELVNVNAMCTPLHYGKMDSLVKELYTVAGGFDSQFMILNGFWAPGDQGGGIFFWNQSQAKSGHNGSTIIDPDKIIDLGSGPGAPPPAYTTPNMAGTGCWVRVYTGAILVEWLGGV